MIKEVPILEGVEVKLEGNELTVRGPKGELKRKFQHHAVKMEVKDNKIVVSSENNRRKIKAIVGTWAAHVKNMMIGVTKGWQAKLKIVYSHFPIKFSVEGNKAVIQNFLGERDGRTARIYDDVRVELKKDVVVVTGINKEHVGQTAANIESAAKVKGFDRRVFQDGIHLIQKCTPIEDGEG